MKLFLKATSVFKSVPSRSFNIWKFVVIKIFDVSRKSICPLIIENNCLSQFINIIASFRLFISALSDETPKFFCQKNDKYSAAEVSYVCSSAKRAPPSIDTRDKVRVIHLIFFYCSFFFFSF